MPRKPIPRVRPEPRHNGWDITKIGLQGLPAVAILAALVYSGYKWRDVERVITTTDEHTEQLNKLVMAVGRIEMRLFDKKPQGETHNKGRAD